MRIAYRHAGGFTLIEIAVVLVIIALVGAGATSATIALIGAAREKITRQNQDAIKVALQNFVARNGRLPCPAVPTTLSTAATFGLEAPTPGTCTGATALGTTGFTGTLPWKSLGVQTDNAIDGWDNQFDYAVTKTAVQASLATVAVMRGVLTLHTATPVANGLPATGNQINACSTTAGDNACNLFAAVILLSHGPNGLGARTRTGVARPVATSALELENTDADVAFVLSERSDSGANEFDDMVVALTPADVLAPLLAQGFVKYDAVALDQKFRQLTAALSAYAVENRSGTPGDYTYPLPTANSPFAFALDATKFDGNCDSNPPTSIGLVASPDMQLIKDPWGNAFQYQRATATVRALESCPTFAVFVSAGPDGNFATGNDNSVYYLSRGEFDAIIALSGW